MTTALETPSSNGTRHEPDVLAGLDIDDPLAGARANIESSLTEARNKLAAAQRAADTNTAAKDRANKSIIAARATIERCKSESEALNAAVSAAGDTVKRLQGALARLDPTQRVRS